MGIKNQHTLSSYEKARNALIPKAEQYADEIAGSAWISFGRKDLKNRRRKR